MTDGRDRPTGGADRWRRVRRWRRRRPFWGGLMLICAAGLVGYLPAAYGDVFVVASGSFTGSALLFAALLLLCGLIVLAVPSLSSLFGLLGMALSAVALLGALGGLLLGTLVGGLGGLLAFAWEPSAEPVAEGGASAAGRVGQFSWEDDGREEES